MKYGIVRRGSPVGMSLFHRSWQATREETRPDLLVYLGSSIALTKSNGGSLDDGEIHGSQRLKERDK